jgi:prepilin-type N-terminal cleavage/methylation domain-containing protein
MIFMKKQAGLSLIEIMISIVIGSILMIGLINLFMANKHSHRIQESLGSAQENGRFALQVLDYSLRMTDHWGGIDADVVSGNAAITWPGGCNGGWTGNLTEGIRGFDGAAVLPAALTSCFTNYLPNTDAFVVRYASADGLVTDANVGAGANATTFFVRSSAERRGEVFKGSDGIPAGLAAQDGTYNYPYAVELYYIKCTFLNGATCDEADPLDIPTLTRLRLSNTGAMTEEELIENVEQMQIEYGIDTNSDNAPDLYATATEIDAMATSRWPNVVSTRISVVARSNTRDASFTEAVNYTLAGGYVHQTSSSALFGEVQQFRRRVYTHTIQIRNRSRS